MSDTTEHIRDARRAYGELAASLSILADKMSEAQGAISGGDYGRAQRALGGASAELDAAHGYLAAAGDSHQAIGRCLNSAKAAA